MSGKADPRRIKRVRIHRREPGTTRPLRRERSDKDRPESDRLESERPGTEISEPVKTGSGRSDAA